MKYKFGAVLLALVLGCAALSGCGGSMVPADDYNYRNEAFDPADWRAVEGDADMRLDGVFDEGNYANAESFSYTPDVPDTGMEVKTYLGEKGAYFAVRVTDAAVYYNAERKVYENSSAELYVLPANAKILSRDCVQLRVGANGYTEQWVGIPSDADGYAWTRAYVPSQAAVRINGTLNSGEAQGFDAEIFLPYSSLNLAARPEGLKILPAFNHVENASLGNAERKYCPMPGGVHEKPSTYVTVGVKPDIAIDGDLSDWTAGDAAQVRANDGSGRGYTLKARRNESGIYLALDALHNDFIRGEDPWHKNTNFEFFVDGVQMWVTADGTSSPSIRAAFVTSAAAPYTTTAEVFIPDSIVGARGTVGFAFKTPGEKITADGGITDNDWWYPADAVPTSAPYIVTADGLERAEALRADVTIDGDLTDWTDESVRLNKVVVADAAGTGKGFTVMGFFNKNGLHLAYEAVHSIFKKDEADWWKNTNAEFFIMGDQKWAAAGKAADGVQAAFITTEQNGMYRSVVEMFVPADQFVSDYAGLTTLAGFAFKTEGDKISVADAINRDDKGIKNDDWWYAVSHAPNQIGEHYYVNPHGIFYADPRP